MATQVNTTNSVVRVLTSVTNTVDARTTNQKVQVLTKAPSVDARTTQAVARVLESSTSANPKVYTTQSNVKALTQTASASPYTYTTQTVIRVLEANSDGGSPPGGASEVVEYALASRPQSFTNGRAVFLSSRRVITPVGDSVAFTTKESLDAMYDPRFDDPQYYKSGR